jgi:aminoglycoside 3-N-acetyltransferase
MKANVSKEQVLDGLRAVGIQKGDVLYVASSLAALGLMPDPVQSVLWALREAVGPEGTLVMPTFNFSFCETKIFDRENSPSRVGVLTEAFRHVPSAKRTWSAPFQTVAAIGPLAVDICSKESLTSFGKDSAFHYLYEIGAKQLLIGCGYHDGVTHTHWLEEQLEVPYRYWKKFEGEIILDGKRQHRTFFMYVRRKDVDLRLDAGPVLVEFESAGFVRKATVGLCHIKAFQLKDFKDVIGEKLAKDPLLFLVSKEFDASLSKRSAS